MASNVKRKSALVPTVAVTVTVVLYDLVQTLFWHPSAVADIQDVVAQTWSAVVEEVSVKLFPKKLAPKIVMGVVTRPLKGRVKLTTGASKVREKPSCVPTTAPTVTAVRANPQLGGEEHRIDVALLQLLVKQDALPMTTLSVDGDIGPKLKPARVTDEPPEATALLVMYVSTAASKVKLASRVPTSFAIVAPTRTRSPIPGFPLHKKDVPDDQEVVAHTV